MGCEPSFFLKMVEVGRVRREGDKKEINATTTNKCFYIVQSFSKYATIQINHLHLQ